MITCFYASFVHLFSLKDSRVNLNLSVIDTPGFGDAIDNSECWTKIVDYVNKQVYQTKNVLMHFWLENKLFQFENYLNGETRVNRTTMKDMRVHACIYFIAPNGHGLKVVTEGLNPYHK